MFFIISYKFHQFQLVWGTLYKTALVFWTLIFIFDQIMFSNLSYSTFNTWFPPEPNIERNEIEVIYQVAICSNEANITEYIIQDRKVKMRNILIRKIMRLNLRSLQKPKGDEVLNTDEFSIFLKFPDIDCDSLV